MYRGRRSVAIENENLRVTVLVEGGHIAEMFHKASGVNPLWTPPWPTIEPSTYDAAKHPEYGGNSESKLLAGIMGHNLCLDIFGAPTATEAAAGITVHGEGSVVPYEIEAGQSRLTMRAKLPLAGLAFVREITLDKVRVLFRETVENLSASDRPIAWTQHVTLGPPFLERGRTQLSLPGTRCMTLEGRAFDWPGNPFLIPAVEKSAGFSTHLMDPHETEAWFTAKSPTSKLEFGYRWPRKDFPWLGMWQENNSRTTAPWNGRTFTRGMEFGASPMPESRQAMIERRELFGVPAYRWLPARSNATVEYYAYFA